MGYPDESEMLKHEGFWIIVIVSSVVLLALGIVFGFMVFSNPSEDGLEVVPFNESISNVSCASYSMLYNVYCGNRVTKRSITVSSTDELVVGRIYVFKYNESVSAIHRYMGSVNSSHAIFMGDANRNIEKVDVKDIRSIVVKIEFEEVD